MPDAASLPGAPLPVAVFGKHPGWDDHIDDLGVFTTALVEFKRLFYTEGVGGAIDSGAWDAVPEAARTAGFAHDVLWRAGTSGVLARFWASRDGKGRSRYPMVAAADVSSVADDRACAPVLRALADLETRCAGASDAPGVIGAWRASLATAGPAPGSIGPALACIAARGAYAERRETLYRTLFEFDSTFGAFRDADAARTLGARVVRVAVAAEDFTEDAALWRGAVEAFIGGRLDVAIIRGRPHSWTDVLVGRPTGAALVCFRAGDRVMARAGDVPYTIDDAFARACERAIAGGRAVPERSSSWLGGLFKRRAGPGV